MNEDQEKRLEDLEKRLKGIEKRLDKIESLAALNNNNCKLLANFYQEAAPIIRNNISRSKMAMTGFIGLSFTVLALTLLVIAN